MEQKVLQAEKEWIIKVKNLGLKQAKHGQVFLLSNKMVASSRWGVFKQKFKFHHNGNQTRRVR